MKTKFTDALQIIAALLITGGMVVSAAPLPTQASHKVAEKTANVTKQNIETKSIVNAPKTSAEPSKIVSKPKKVITWHDNPNHCTDEQWIAKEAPYLCIDKPTQVKSASDVAISNHGVTVSGNKQTWLTASGIPSSEWWAVDWIVSRESGWNPCAYYPGHSNCSASPYGACGLVQQNPCGKIPGRWTDPVAALRWQYQYVTARYGGYAEAVYHWQNYGSY